MSIDKKSRKECNEAELDDQSITVTLEEEEGVCWAGNKGDADLEMQQPQVEDESDLEEAAESAQIEACVSPGRIITFAVIGGTIIVGAIFALVKMRSNNQDDLLFASNDV